MRAGSKEGGGSDRGRVAGSGPVATRGPPPPLCMSQSLWRSPAEDTASDSTPSLGLIRPPADGAPSVAPAVAAAVEAAGAARLPLPFAHSARPGVVVPAVPSAVAPIAGANHAAAVASQNAVTRQRPTRLHHHTATG